MKRKTQSVFEIFTFLSLLFGVKCQFYDEIQSPCPDVFMYQNHGNTINGYITFKSESGRPVRNVHLRANFTVAARLSTTYIGQIEAIGNNLLEKFNQGVPLQYRVHFPVISPLPRLTSIVVNGRRLCYGPGDIPGPLQYVTTLSLDHMLFSKGSNSQSFDTYEPSEPELTYEGQFGDNTQVFTINDLGNRDGSWTSGVYPIDHYLVMNITRPTRPNYEKPTKPRPNRPQVQPVRPQVQPIRPQVQTIRPQVQPIQPLPEYTESIPSPEFNAYDPDLTTQTPRPILATPVTATEVPPFTPSRRPDAASIGCGMIAGSNERVPLIFNGNSYPRGDWPWLVAIYKRQEGSLTFICAGTLISDRHVVTAAHCMHQRSKISTIKDIVVKVGVYNLEDWGDDISVTRTLQTAKIHESYNATTLENDILVFTMEKTVEFNNYIRPACLWNGNTDLGRIVGASGVVAGWGQSEVSPVGKGEPRMVRIPIVSTSTCRASKPEFHKLTSSNTLCAGDRKGSGPCLGDSGGGLYILDNGRWRLRGVVSLSLRPSNGDSTCNLNEYIVFTDTAKYLTWIKKYISINLYDF